MPSYHEIFQNNAAWAAQKTSQDPNYFLKLAANQNPDYLYIGCSDSRVTAEDLMGLQPGEVFVHRNVANLVSATDMNVMAVVDYAVRVLKVRRIIVCGHYECGGVKAAMLPEDMGLLNPWLRNIRDVYRIHAEELDKITDVQQRYDRLVELNVQEQCVNIIKTAAVQQRYVTEGYPTVHGWVFNVRDGLLKDLEIDFPNILQHIQKIYNLTGHKSLF